MQKVLFWLFLIGGLMGQLTATEPEPITESNPQSQILSSQLFRTIASYQPLEYVVKNALPLAGYGVPLALFLGGAHAQFNSYMGLMVGTLCLCGAVGIVAWGKLGVKVGKQLYNRFKNGGESLEGELQKDFIFLTPRKEHFKTAALYLGSVLPVLACVTVLKKMIIDKETFNSILWDSSSSDRNVVAVLNDLKQNHTHSGREEADSISLGMLSLGGLIVCGPSLVHAILWGIDKLHQKPIEPIQPPQSEQASEPDKPAEEPKRRHYRFSFMRGC